MTESSWEYVYVDTETDNLLAKLTKVHIVGCLDLKTKEVRQFTEKGEFDTETFEDFKVLAKSVKKWVAHNGICFDFPVLNKFFHLGIAPENVLIDTLIMSRIIDFRREGGHSLKNLAKLAGSYKGDYTDGFETLNEKMVLYNKQDLISGDAVLTFLRKEKRAPPLSVLTLENEVQFLCEEIRENGFYFDIDKCNALITTLSQERDSLESKIASSYPYMPKLNKSPTVYRVKKDGTPYKAVSTALASYDSKDVEIAGDYTVIKWLPFNPSSRQQIIWQLRHKGWQPIKFTEKGNPTIDEDVLETLHTTFEDVKDIIEYLIITKRLSQVQSWADVYNPATHRVHGTINGIGARTHRASHVNPNTGQVPGVRLGEDDKPLMGLSGTYNFECRDCWSVPSGYSLVGVDASAIQLVILAHCVDDPALTFSIENGKKSNGTDIHSFNRDILRGVIKEILGCKDANYFSRASSKTFTYAFLLGAGGPKLAAICGVPSEKGKMLKDLYLKRLPKLASFLSKLTSEVFFTESVLSLDGRKYLCDNAHFALAFILQGYEALIMKMVGVRLARWIKSNNLSQKVKIVAWVHDEYQMETRKGFEKEVISKVVSLIEEVGVELGLKCELTGSGDYGKSWATSH